ncbi:MAG TPA: DUF2306 domain-containing protein [Terriglobia bacterium]|nr:DUF2306 domain-containing protein [Terriglobia bacterium]
MSAEKVENRATKRSLILLAGAWIVALIFVAGFALPYFGFNPDTFGGYWVKRGWLLTHLAAGMVALLVGPFALRLGLARKRMPLHRRLGVVYMVAIGLSSLAALYLSLHTDVSWVFGMGLFSLNLIWITTAGFALVAIRRRQIQQHQEWMIRSYVVTFGFVNFRILVGILTAIGVGTEIQRLEVGSWFCWSVPLVITEVILQGRKMFSAPVASTVGRAR